MQTFTAPQAVQAIVTAQPVKDTRFVERINVGQFARQGDIYIVAIDKLPDGAKPTQDRQLAPGSTQGSRHTVGAEVKVFNPKNLGEIVTTKFGKSVVGPCIESDGFLLVAHPEHADISLPAGTYQTYGQYDPSTERRVVD